MHSHFDLQLIKLPVIPNLTSAGGQERDLTRSVQRCGRDQDIDRTAGVADLPSYVRDDAIAS